MASIKELPDKDGKIRYHVQVRIKGSPPQYASIKRKTDAERWIQQTESAIREGRHFKTTAAKKHTLGQLIDRYMSDVLPTKKKCEQRQGAQLLWWKKQIGIYLLSDITPALIAEQRDCLLKGMTKRGRQRSPSTVVRYMAVLSHAFTIAIKEWGWIEDSPLRKVTKPREPRGRIRFLDEPERARLLQACKDSPNSYLYTIVILALSTGMRQAEIMNLKWSDVDFEKERVILQETKNGDIRQVAITGHALELLKQLDKLRRLDTHYLFPGKFPRKPIDIRSAWETAVKKSQIDNLRFHDLRHSCASYLAMNGASLAEIAEVLGHKTLAMVKRYAHLSETHTAGVLSRMNQKNFWKNWLDMALKQNLEENVKKYKKYLIKLFWELREAVALLSGSVDFGLCYSLDDEISRAFGISSFGMSPLNFDEEKRKNDFKALLKLISKAAKEDIITAKAIKPFKIEYRCEPKNYTYLLKPHELIFLTVKEGFILPIELQTALKMYQIDLKRVKLSKPMIKDIKREAIAYAIWCKHPNESINKITEKFQSLGRDRGYEFIYDSEEKARYVVRKVKPKPNDVQGAVPGTMKKLGNIIAFNFQRLNVVLNTWADLISLQKPNLTFEEIIQHPFIDCYIQAGGGIVGNFLHFSLREFKEIMYLKDAKPDL